MRSKLAASLSLVVSLASPPAGAKPFKPTRDDEVLVTLLKQMYPRQAAELSYLERAHAAAPANADVAERLAGSYVGIGSRDGDPRYFGMARAVLRPWIGAADAPLGIIELRAEILGFGHEFDAAMKDYDLVLAKDPHRTSARLARAVLQTVRGRLDLAEADCVALDEGTQERMGCVMTLALARNDGKKAFGAYDETPATSAWLLELGAEAADLIGDEVQAEGRFERSLAKDDRVFTRAAFADFYMRLGRAADALKILPADSRNLGIMVRRAAALVSTDPRGTELGELKSALEDTFALERARGDDVHGRELALYLLDVKKDPHAALPVARANFEKQKERIDALLLARAEAAAK